MLWLRLARKSNPSGRSGSRTTSPPTLPSDRFRSPILMPTLTSFSRSIASVRRSVPSFPRLRPFRSTCSPRLTNYYLAAAFPKASPQNSDGCFSRILRCLSRSPICTTCTRFFRRFSRWFRCGMSPSGELNCSHRSGAESKHFTRRWIPMRMHPQLHLPLEAIISS